MGFLLKEDGGHLLLETGDALLLDAVATAGISGSQPAYLYALSGVMRSGASRSNVHSKATFVAIAGVQYATARAGAAQVDNESLTITENDADTPNTASFDVRGFTPQDGQDVLITQGSINNLDRQFAGSILSDTTGYVGTPANQHDQVHAIDYAWQLMRETITQRWTNVSATVIAQAILAHAGRGFTSRRVEAGLPLVDEFTVTNETHLAALKRLADRVGATVKPTYLRDVKFGITLGAETDPTILTAASAPSVEMTDFSVTRDLSQVITRQPVEGGGSIALTEIPPGETILPVDTAVWYNPAGGQVASGPQHLTYTGTQIGGTGTLVGPAQAPITAPTAAGRSGSGLTSGIHGLAYTFVSAAGETLPSPLASFTAGTIAPPASAPTVVDSGSGFGPTAGGTYRYGLSLANAAFTIETALSPIATYTPSVSHTAGVTFTITAAMVGYKVPIYRSDNGGGYTIIMVFGPIAAGDVGNLAGFSDTNGSVSGGTGPLNNATINQVDVGFATGPTGTTGRNIYLTAAGAAQLKLAATIANNSATTTTLSLADGSLGANAPTTDTSGLVTVPGQINAGATSILTGGTAPFAATGGWAISGQQVIRYTGLSGNTLTGIPATGPGSITTTLLYGAQITAAPALTGIPASGAGSIVYTIRQGDPVNVRVVVDDLAAQAALAALIGGGDDGIIEGALIQDGRISETEARARGLAQLALRKSLDVAVSLTSKDRNLHASRDQGVNLTQPACVGTFKIRSVTIGNFHPSRWPTKQASAASTRFTLEDLLRDARAAAGSP